MADLTALESQGHSEAGINMQGGPSPQHQASPVTSTSLKGKMKQTQKATDSNASGTEKGAELFSRKGTRRKKRKDKKPQDSNVTDDPSHELVTTSGGLRLESVFVGTLSAEHRTVGTAHVQKAKHMVILWYRILP